LNVDDIEKKEIGGWNHEEKGQESGSREKLIV